MKKYFALLILIVFMVACGNSGKDEEKTEMTPEEEQAFVEEETKVIDESVKAVETDVDQTEEKVNELIKDI